MMNICQDQILVGAGEEVAERGEERRETETVQELRAATGGGPELLSTGKGVPSISSIPHRNKCV